MKNKVKFFGPDQSTADLEKRVNEFLDRVALDTSKPPVVTFTTAGYSSPNSGPSGVFICAMVQYVAP